VSPFPFETLITLPLPIEAVPLTQLSEAGCRETEVEVRQQIEVDQDDAWGCSVPLLFYNAN